MPPRWYIPPGDVRWDRLTPSPHHTTCQYKGQACYWTVDGTDPPLPVWSYLQPLPEAASLAGLIGIPITTRQCNTGTLPPGIERIPTLPAAWLLAPALALGRPPKMRSKPAGLPSQGPRALRHGFLFVRHPGPPRAALTRGASYWTAWYSLRLAWAHAG